MRVRSPSWSPTTGKALASAAARRSIMTACQPCHLHRNAQMGQCWTGSDHCAIKLAYQGCRRGATVRIGTRTERLTHASFQQAAH